MATAELVDECFEYAPECCSGCGESFEGSEEQVGDPVIHQKWELPEVKPLIYEYRQLRLHCPRCGKPQLADLPLGVTTSVFGPRIEAHIATLAGVYRLSRSQITEVVKEMFGIPISTGAVDATLMRMSAVLADPWNQLQEAVRRADLVHIDETGWRLNGDGQWLWLAASSLAACYRIDHEEGRDEQGPLGFNVIEPPERLLCIACLNSQRYVPLRPNYRDPQT